MAAGGVPEPTFDHANRVARAAIELLKRLEEIKEAVDTDEHQLGIRIGKRCSQGIFLTLVSSSVTSGLWLRAG